MLKRLAGRLSYANVMATAAVFIAVGGGAYAAGLGKDSVGSKQIKDGQVKSVDVKDGGLLAKDFAPESLSAIAARPVATQTVQAQYHEGSRIPLNDSSWTQGPGEVDQIIGTFTVVDEPPPGVPACTGTTASVYFVLGSNVFVGNKTFESAGKYTFTSDPIMYSGHEENHTLQAWANVSWPCPVNYSVSDMKLAVLSYR